MTEEEFGIPGFSVFTVSFNDIWMKSKYKRV